MTLLCKSETASVCQACSLPGQEGRASFNLKLNLQLGQACDLLFDYSQEGSATLLALTGVTTHDSFLIGEVVLFRGF